MDNTVWNEVNSTLDLNGPILSFSEQPTGATGIGTTVGAIGGASISFTGIATGVDPGTGYLSYQWYEENKGKLSDDTYTSGTASTGPVGTAATLTLSNLWTKGGSCTFKNMDIGVLKIRQNEVGNDGNLVTKEFEVWGTVTGANWTVTDNVELIFSEPDLDKGNE